MLNVFEAVLFVKLESLLVIALHMQRHFFDFSCFHAVFDCLLQKLGADTVPAVWLQHSDCHDVANTRAVILDVFFARDGTHEDIFDICEL